MILLLSVMLAVGVVARLVRIPYTVGLVIAGLIIGLVPHHVTLTLTPDLITFVFLPALLFAGAWNMPLDELRRNWVPIALLATVGVVIGIVVADALLVLGAGLSVRTALVFGAIVAATDPVAVLALFRSMRVQPALATIVEGESLFNDGTAVVAFRIISAGFAGAVVFNPLTAAGQFAWLVVGGVAVGIAVGLVAWLALRLVDDYLLEAAGTTIAAYGAFTLAEALHFSGIVAVIAAGIALSGIGRRLGSFTSNRTAVNQFWEFVAFLANSTLFLLIGLAVDLRSLAAAGAATAWGVVAMIGGRLIAVYGLAPVAGVLGRPLPPSWRHALVVGGLRGALSMALVLSLPVDYPDRALLVQMVFFAVLFTLLVQGLSLGPAIGALRLFERDGDAARTAASTRS